VVLTWIAFCTAALLRYLEMTDCSYRYRYIGYIYIGYLLLIVIGIDIISVYVLHGVDEVLESILADQAIWL
jgi:hypothetical protein